MRNIDSKSRPRTQFRFKYLCSDSIVAFGRIADDFFNSIGPKRTWASALQMSAFGGKADMRSANQNVCFDPQRTLPQSGLIHQPVPHNASKQHLSRPPNV